MGMIPGDRGAEFGNWFYSLQGGFTPFSWVEVGYLHSSKRSTQLTLTGNWGYDTWDASRFWNLEVAPALEDVKSGDLVYRVIRLCCVTSQVSYVPGSDSYFIGYSVYAIIPAQWQWTWSATMNGYEFAPMVTVSRDTLCPVYFCPNMEFDFHGLADPMMGRANQVGERKLGGKVPGNDASGEVHTVSEIPAVTYDDIGEQNFANSRYHLQMVSWRNIHELFTSVWNETILSQPAAATAMANAGHAILDVFALLWRAREKDYLFDLWLLDPEVVGFQVFPEWRTTGELSPTNHYQDASNYSGLGLPTLFNWEDWAPEYGSLRWQYIDTSSDPEPNPYKWSGQQTGYAYRQIWGHLNSFPYITPEQFGRDCIAKTELMKNKT